MTELLAVLTAVFVVYALYEVFATVSQSGDGLNRTAADSQAAQLTATFQQPTTPKVAASAAPSATLAAAPPSISAATHDKQANLRNPVTGEISPTPGNYRFAKKWIKEALVVEGLLPRIYKNSELTETLNMKAKEAIEKFKNLEKYHV